MTRIDDLPKALANGTLTCCRSCGRMAIFAETNKSSTSTQDIWTCACLTENAVPVRDSDVSARQSTRALSPSPTQTKEGKP